MYALRGAYGLPYNMAIFIATKGLVNTVYMPSEFESVTVSGSSKSASKTRMFVRHQ